MLIPRLIAFIIISAIFLWVGFRKNRVGWLFAINAVWWLVSIGLTFITFEVWKDRAYSENWAGIGFLFVVLPFAVPILIMSIAEIYFVHKRKIDPKKGLFAVLIPLIAFLLLQIAVGLFSM
jgi:hypothetical protein